MCFLVLAVYRVDVYFSFLVVFYLLRYCRQGGFRRILTLGGCLDSRQRGVCRGQGFGEVGGGMC